MDVQIFAQMWMSATPSGLQFTRKSQVGPERVGTEGLPIYTSAF